MTRFVRIFDGVGANATMRYHRILLGVVVLFLALVVALGAGITSIVGLNRVERVAHKNRALAIEARKNTEALAQLRAETEVANCVAFNVSRDAVRTALKDSLKALVPAGTTLTAEQQARVDLYDARVDAGLPFRDCSPAGIAAFLKNQPPDPALNR